QELTPQLGEYFGVPNGVLVASVAADSAAARANVKAGDVVTMLDKIVVRTADDLRRLLDERHVGDRVMLSIVRNRKPMTVTVTLESARTRVRPI
ncbi:MAG: PDZ domain-containing protein, partial [Bacteroidales bacterium]